MSETVKKCLVALAAHPLDASVVLQLHEDSSMSASSLDVTQRTLVPLWQFPLRDTPTTITSVGLTRIVHAFQYIASQACKASAQVSMQGLRRILKGLRGLEGKGKLRSGDPVLAMGSLTSESMQIALTAGSV